MATREEPRRLRGRQGLQSAAADGKERNAPYEPISEGARRAQGRGDYGPEASRKAAERTSTDPSSAAEPPESVRGTGLRT
jgi:hypothetical protein